MLNKVFEKDVRFTKIHMSIFGTNYLHRKNPWAAAWWSAALPGFGHLYIGAHIMGLLFMTGEIFINVKARINLAIFYTFIGEFEKANNIFAERWGLYYIAIWVFSIYDAYIMAIKGNKICELEEMQEKRYFERFRMSTLGVNYLTQREPSDCVTTKSLST